MLWLCSSALGYLARAASSAIRILLWIVFVGILCTAILVLAATIIERSYRARAWLLKGLMAVVDTQDMLSAWSAHSVPLLWRKSSSKLQQICRTLQCIPKHEYRPLGTDEIRLLQIQPRAWSLQGAVYAKLIHVKRGSPSPYTAISYTWGSTCRTEEIVVDGARFKVTKSALNVLLSSSSRTDTVSLWIDAICINQNDVKEKNHQVRSIKQTYQDATRVLAFPGCNWRGIQAARMLQKQAEYSSKTGGNVQTEAKGLLNNIRALYCEPPLQLTKILDGDYEHIREDLSAISYARPWQAVLALAQDEYFQRAWVIQELYVGEQVELYLCGISIPYEMFSAVMLVLGRPDISIMVHMHDPARSQKGRVRGYFGQGKYIGSAHFHSNLRTRSEKKQQTGLDEEPESDPARLQSLLFEATAFGATDKRDKLFAIVGIASDVVGEQAPEMLPDYEKTIGEVCEAFARYLLLRQKFPSVSVLALAGIGFSHGRSPIPSWVPDLDGDPHPTVLTPYVPLPGKHLQACGAMTTVEVTANRRSGHPVISVAGVLCDTIVGLCNDPYSPGDEGDGTVEHLDLAVAKWDFLTRAVTIARDIPRARGEEPKDKMLSNAEILATLTAGSVPGIPYAAVARWVAMLQKASETGTNEEYVRFLHEHYPLSGTGDKDKDEVTEASAVFDAVMSSRSRSRCFAITAKQRYCLVPPLAHARDVVFVPFGAHFPFLIRRKRDGDGAGSGCYELVGEAYVYGIMNGEVMGESATTIDLV